MGIYGDLQNLNHRPSTPPQKPEAKPATPGEPISEPIQIESVPNSTPQATVIPRHHATKPPRHRDTTMPRYHDTLVQIVRGAVKLFGKEAATHRFTLEEKKAIADIVYTYKQGDIKTSENEVTRIGVNFIINDYQENGENSVLHRVLKALNS